MAKAAIPKELHDRYLAVRDSIEPDELHPVELALEARAVELKDEEQTMLADIRARKRVALDARNEIALRRMAILRLRPSGLEITPALVDAAVVAPPAPGPNDAAVSPGPADITLETH